MKQVTPRLPVIKIEWAKADKLLVDTCVWIDLAKDQTKPSLLHALEELVRLQEVNLILPQTVIDEFARNRQRVLKENAQSFASTLKRAREAMTKFGDPKFRRTVDRELIEVERKLVNAGDEADNSVARIEKLFAGAEVRPTSDAIKLRASQRAIEKTAPFHGGRNSFNDAVLIETYAELVSEKSPHQRYAFVTHNHKDFSSPNAGRKLPHPDLVQFFSRIRSRYFISLADALRAARPYALRDLLIEQEWSDFPPRRFAEIVEAEDQFLDMIWYDRHMLRRQRIEEGKIRVVEEETYKPGARLELTIPRDIWEGALRAAAKVRKRRGVKNLGPHTKFEWGMLNGKLSALRWVLGDEWDMLDT